VHVVDEHLLLPVGLLLHLLLEAAQQLLALLRLLLAHLHTGFNIQKGIFYALYEKM
jgi:hypothetical protein